MKIPKESDLFGKIFISYIDLMEQTELRRKKLREQYFFQCLCLRCQGKKLSWFPGCGRPGDNNNNSIQDYEPGVGGETQKYIYVYNVGTRTSCFMFSPIVLKFTTCSSSNGIISAKLIA